jgi:Thioredoxin
MLTATAAEKNLSYARPTHSFERSLMLVTEKIIAVTQKAVTFTTGLTFSEFLENTPALWPGLQNRRREVRLSGETQEFLVNYPDALHWVVLLSEDAPETTVVMPIMVRMAQASPRFTLHLAGDHELPALLNTLADDLELNGDAPEIDLPQLLLYDEEWNFQGQWGPHPQAADPYLDEWFAQHPEYETLAESAAPADQEKYALLLNELTHEMRVWYNSGLNRAAIQEIHALLATLLEESDDEEVNGDK